MHRDTGVWLGRGQGPETTWPWSLMSFLAPGRREEASLRTLALTQAAVPRETRVCAQLIHLGGEAAPYCSGHRALWGRHQTSPTRGALTALGARPQPPAQVRVCRDEGRCGGTACRQGKGGCGRCPRGVLRAQRRDALHADPEASERDPPEAGGPSRRWARRAVGRGRVPGLHSGRREAVGVGAGSAGSGLCLKRPSGCCAETGM